MRLYLIRHAHAVDAAEDAERPLSRKGREQVKRLAHFLRESEVFQPDEIWHSPLQRSQQTAKLLSRRLDIHAPLVEVEGLEPEDDPRATVLRVKNLRRVVAIVGHEPHLSALASQLVSERDRGGRGSRWLVRWQVSPELLP